MLELNGSVGINRLRTLPCFRHYKINEKGVIVCVQLSEKSSIPVEHIDIAKPTGVFPYELSVLSLPELEWNLKVPTLESWPLQFTDDGGVLLYKSVMFTIADLLIGA